MVTRSATASRLASGTQPREGLYQREGAMQELLGALDDVTRDGTMRLVELRGDAGLGKTRLLVEFEAAARATDSGSGARFAYGRALAAHSQGNGFQPLREALSDLFSDTTGGALRRLARSLTDNAPAWLNALPAVGPAAQALAQTVRDARRGAEGLGESVNEQFARFLRDATDDVALVLMLDDLHWADESTVDLLFYLTQTVTGGCPVARRT
jgi:predicted ATPase